MKKKKSRKPESTPAPAPAETQAPEPIVKKVLDSDETDEDEIPKDLKEEYDWRISQAIKKDPDEDLVTKFTVNWSGEDIMNRNQNLVIYDYRLISLFQRILGAYNE